MKPLVRRVSARLVDQQWAERVVSPAYDAMRPEQRLDLMAEDPYVFLHVTRSPVEGEDPDEVNERNARALEWLVEQEVFSEVHPAGMFAYRLRTDTHVQTGVVADIHLSGLADGRIGPHERIQPQRAGHLADHLTRVAVHSSPVAFGYEGDPRVDEIVAEVTAGEPDLVIERGDGLHQTIWSIPARHLDTLETALSAHRLYIIDGHHRVAAAVESWRRAGNDDPGGWVLGALFPNEQLNVSAFHRRVDDLNGLSPDELASAIAEQDFEVRPLDDDESPEPPTPGRFSMYVDGRWFEIKPFRVHPAEFDVTILQERILGPVLGIDEASRGGRLEYLPGAVGLEHLVEVTDRQGGVAFALHPVLLSQLTAVVDKGMTLPPKSTYFEPKVRSGIFLAPR
ncbi:MAG: DUF1015 family protein [Actinomycetota bacterium]